MEIREVKIDDSQAIARLLTELDYPATANFISSKIRAQLEDCDATLLVAVEGNEVLGFISLHFIPQLALPGDFCRISYFCVRHDSRSKGVGAALEEKASSLARDKQCDRIEVHCHARRNLAHKFYDRQGYSESPKYLLKLLN